jgi:hypothetical protein
MKLELNTSLALLLHIPHMAYRHNALAANSFGDPKEHCNADSVCAVCPGPYLI